MATDRATPKEDFPESVIDNKKATLISPTAEISEQNDSTTKILTDESVPEKIPAPEVKAAEVTLAKEVSGELEPNDTVVVPIPGATNRGQKNNNVFNISMTGDKWKGMVGDDGTYVKFNNLQNNIRAADILVKNYGDYDIDNLHDFAHRYAPPWEKNDKGDFLLDDNGKKIAINDTANWIDVVAGLTSLSPYEEIDLNDPKVRAILLPAIAQIESGSGSLLTPELIAAAQKH